MNAQQKLDWAHLGMMASLLIIALSVLTAYVWDTDQNLLLQGIAHLSMLLFAVVFKLSYILRLHALHSLGRSVD